MFSCWYEAHCWQCHDKNGLTSASPVSCGSTGAITPPLVTKLSLQTLLGELLGAPVNIPQLPTLLAYVTTFFTQDESLSAEDEVQNKCEENDFPVR